MRCRRLPGWLDFMTLAALLASAPPVPAEVTLDGTLGPSSALAGPNHAVTADLGRQVGGNLFHSFAVFNLTASETATFSGPSSVANVISRVTGGTLSSIDGRIASTIPGANFYFLNPAGILFGPNAVLDISGSVHFGATDHLGFADGAVFNAAVPATNSFSAAAPEAFGFLALGFLGTGGTLRLEGSKLWAGLNQSLNFTAGDITLHNAGIGAFSGGRIGLSALRSIQLVNSQVWAFGMLDTPPGRIRIDGGQIVLDNSLLGSYNYSSVRASDVELRGESIELARGSTIKSYTEAAGRGANLSIHTGSFLAHGMSAEGYGNRIFSQTTGSGDAGNITASTRSIHLLDGAQIGSDTWNTFGGGASGYIDLYAQDNILISGVDGGGYSSAVFAESLGTGTAGWIDLTARSITLNEGGKVSASTYNKMEGAGNSGYIDIHASDSLRIAGNSANGTTSEIFAVTHGTGDAGFIVIEAGQVDLVEGGQISASSLGTAPGSGDGGLIRMTADALNISGMATNGARQTSGITSTSSGPGWAGYIDLHLGQLNMSDGGQISNRSTGTMEGAGNGLLINLEVTDRATLVGGSDSRAITGIDSNTEGPGMAGHVSLRAGELQLLDGAQIASTSEGAMDGAGNGGNIDIEVAGETLISGVGTNGYPSALVTETYGTGDAGNIGLRTGSLVIADGGSIAGSSFGAGRGANIDVFATGDIRITGVNETYDRSSEVASDSSASGAAGWITLEGRRIELLDGGSVSSVAWSAEGGGSWGEVSLTASESVRVDGAHVGGNGTNYYSGIYSNTEGTAFAGDIVIQAPRLEVTNGGIIASGSLGQMEGARGQGRIDILADTILLSGVAPNNNPSVISTQTEGPGRAGEISLWARNLELRGGAEISSASLSKQDNAGPGGSIKINVSHISLDGHRPDGIPTGITAASEGPGLAGDIDIYAGHSLVLAGGAEIATRAEQADGGNIDIQVGHLLKLSDSRIVTSVGSGRGNGGNIDIDPEFVVLDNSLIQANAYGGDGGNIRIVTDHLVASTDSRIEASSALGIDGSIEISSPNVDVGSGLAVLPSNYLDAAALLRDACAGRAAGNASSFVGVGHGGLPQGPTGLLTSRYDLLSPTAPAALVEAEHLQAQGKRQAALRQLQALATTSIGDDAVAMATITAALGKAYLLTADRPAAHRQLSSALSAARGTQATALESAILNDLGQLEQIEDRTTGAQEAFAAARVAALRSGDPVLFARAAINAARTMASANPAQDVEAVLREAQDRLTTATDDIEKAYQLIAIGNLLARRPASADFSAHAWHAYAAATRIAAALENPRAASFALGHLGELYAARDRSADARQLLERALFLAQLATAPDAAYRWQWQLGRLHAAAGRDDAAMAAYARAVAGMRGIRSDLMADLKTIRASYRDAVGPLFLEYADLLLRRAAATPEAQRSTWLVQARETLEQLKTVELEDYFQDECIASLRANKKNPDDLPAGTAALYPILLPDRVEMLVSLPRGLRQVRLDVDGATLGKEILTFRRLLEKRTTHQYLPHAQRLHAWLIAPIQPLLENAGIDTLAIIPDGPLRGIPFAALHDGKGFLIERYALAVVPALALVEEDAANDAKRPTLMGGITEAVQDFPALPHVEAEMQSIQSIYGGSKSMRNGEFVRPRFEQELRKAAYSVVHIASHGEIDNDPRKSFLLAYDGRITMDHLEGYLKFNRRKEEAIDLLTLSACRTAAGDDRAALGLAGMAVKSGTRSALATLWYVSDQASSMLMTEFYRTLAAGTGKAAALQAAQRQQLADARYRHPGYWSPFLLIGNWQ